MAETPKKKGTGATSGSKKKTSSPAKGKNKPAARPEDEEEPVLSGRLIIALAILAAMIIIPTQRNIGSAITKTAPQTTARANWKVGETAHVHLTVVTADYAQMACADTRRSNDAHCEYENERERWPREEGAPVDDNKANTLQPYRTTDKPPVPARALGTTGGGHAGTQ